MSMCHHLSLSCYHFFLSGLLANIDLISKTESHSLRLRSNSGNENM